MFILFIVIVVAVSVLVSLRQPSNDRNWSLDQEILPEINIDTNTVTIKNVRNFTYKTKDIYVPGYYDKAFKIADVQSVDYIVEPFSGIGAAHTFLSFGLQDGSYLAISVEIRKKVGDKFSPLRGLLRGYELTYVIADERDVVSLRANYRKNNVYVYPTNLSRENTQNLLVAILMRAQSVYKNPEFYNTITNNCATNIAAHLSKTLQKDVPWDWRLVFPRSSDAFFKEVGIIDYSGDVSSMRMKYHINDKAAQYQDDTNFSIKIRD